MGKRLSQTDYLKKVVLNHNDFFMYEKFEYKGMNKKSTVTCPNHGDFEIIALNHLTRGCPKCSLENRTSKLKTTREEYIDKALKIHPKGYTYSEFIYINAHTPAIITCDIHGNFEQIPNVHLRGSGCKKCSNSNVSKPEIQVQNFVKTLGYEIVSNTRKIIKPYELDIYIPDLNKAIEFNGDWWHYNPKNTKCRGEDYHKMKTKMCEDVQIKLLHVRETDWKNKNNKIRKQIIDFLKQ